MTEKVDKLINELNTMDKSALKELASGLERIFGVSCLYSRPINKSTLPVEKVIEVQTEFDVILHSFGENKLGVIKALRQIKQLGLKEAKELAEIPDAKIFEEVDAETSQRVANQLQAVGAIVFVV